MRKLYFLFPILLFLFGCSPSQKVADEGVFQKRKYMDGWHRSGKGSEETPVTRKDEKGEQGTSAFASDPASDLVANSGIEPLGAPKPKIPEMVKPDKDSCATITKRNGEEIKAIVERVGTEKIEYKKCSRKGGPVYTIEKSEVFQIEYPSGGKDVFEKEENEGNEASDTSGGNVTQDREKEEEKNKKTALGVIGFIFSLIGLVLAIASLGVSLSAAGGLLAVAVILLIGSLIMSGISDAGIGVAGVVLSIIGLVVALGILSLAILAAA